MVAAASTLPHLMTPFPLEPLRQNLEQGFVRLDVLSTCFAPALESHKNYALHPGVVPLLTEAELNDNFLLMCADSFAKEEYLVSGLLKMPYRELVTLVGDGGLGKSFLSLDLALSVASGKDFLGQPVRQGTALYIDVEQNRGTAWQRLAKLANEAGLSLPELQGLFYYRNYQKEGRTLFDFKDEVLELASDVKPDVIVVDGWASAFQIASNNEEEVMEAFNLLKQFLEWGTVFTLAHPTHTGKKSNADALTPSGSRQQYQQPRMILGLQGKSNRHRMTLGISKTNDELDHTLFTLDRVDTLGRMGLKHVLTPPEEKAPSPQSGTENAKPELPDTLQFIRDFVQENSPVQRDNLKGALMQDLGLSPSVAEKALRPSNLKPISKNVTIEKDEENKTKRVLCWHGTMTLRIAEQ